MRIEEKAKAYDEAIKKAKEIKEKIVYSHLSTESCKAVSEYIDTIIPELAESEDERIIEEIKFAVMQMPSERQDTKNRCLAWLEKHKESLHISETCKENADSFTDEDERIRRKIIEHFKSKTKETWCNMPVKDIIAYLEKQKDLAAIPDELVKNYKLFCENGRREVAVLINAINGINEQKEQKPASTEDMPYITDEHFFEREPADSFKYKLAEYMTKCCTKKEGPYGYTYGISAESILQMAKEELIKRGELEEQKPAEWSEEDEKMINYIDCILDENEESTKDSDGMTNTMRQQCLNDISEARKWLKSLRPQPKQQWNKDDEEMRNLIVAIFEVNHPNGFFKANELGTTDMRGVHTEEIISWLKSLRPQPQGVYKTAIESILKMCESYEKKGIFTDERAIDFLGNVRVKCKDAIDCAPILDEPSWKPSEVCYGAKGDPDPAGVWKPSEEDIKMLEHIIGQYETGNKNSKVMGYLPRVEELNFLKKVFEIWKN